jgi:uncharacterized membrane-anchored protein YitT (DUF2179 family)
MLLCAVSRPEAIRPRNTVFSIDPKASVTVGNAHEVLGGGLKAHRKQRGDSAR